MKPTKRILKVAKAIASKDQYLTTERVADALAELKQALLKGKYYTGVDSVSKSGMSRIISIRWIKNGRLYYAPDYVYKLAGCDSNNRITGCGMDMLFAAQYNLYQTLCDQNRQPYQRGMQRYNTL